MYGIQKLFLNYISPSNTTPQGIIMRILTKLDILWNIQCGFSFIKRIITFSDNTQGHDIGIIYVLVAGMTNQVNPQ